MESIAAPLLALGLFLIAGAAMAVSDPKAGIRTASGAGRARWKPKTQDA
jgi:hypothetical protein